jgi:ferric-dicitrate binding protein FerR (iron transport regulator)
LKKKNIKDLEDLVLNESFCEFVQGSNQDSVEFWNEYINIHPDQTDTFHAAVHIVRTLLNVRKDGIITDRNESLKKLLKRVEESEGKSGVSIRYYKSGWFRIAAIGLLVLGLSSLWNVFHTQKEDRPDLSYNEIIVPLGEKAQIILSDGTHVWINSASKFRYPVLFGKESRDVTLEGEAYFDVAKKHGKLFVVNTRDVKVNVLGTAFNVKCYPGDEKTQTTVVRGIVKVEDIHGLHKALIVKPNEMATLQQKSLSGKMASPAPTITINRVNPENLVSWKDQMLVFTGESFEDLAIKMERWFNVNIKIDNDDLKAQRYNGKFVHNETVYQVLEAIKITTPIAFKVNGDTIIISKK